MRDSLLEYPDDDFERCPHGKVLGLSQEPFQFFGAISVCECCGYAYGHFGGIGMNRRCYACQDDEFRASLPKVSPEMAKYSASSSFGVVE